MADTRSLIEGFLVRLEGPMHFRLVLQPLVAVFFAVRDGRRDAREGRAPFFWALFTDPEDRRHMVRSGWKSISKIFIVAIVLDVIFQAAFLKGFFLLGALMAGAILALLPYVLFRGPVSRLFRRGPKSGDACP